jgi:2'-phosphotransferase
MPKTSGSLPHSTFDLAVDPRQTRHSLREANNRPLARGSGDNNMDGPNKDHKPAKSQQQQQQQHRSKRKPAAVSPTVRLSKKLSLVLRHKGVEMGLTMTPDGYVRVRELLALDMFRNVSVEEIRAVVTNCEKQRFKLLEQQRGDDDDDEDDQLYIRANQGHSVAGVLDADQLLTRLTPEALAALPVVLHGTSTKAWTNFIQAQGLSRMGRTHIHFATGLPQDDGVISGMRKHCQVHIYLNTRKCAEDGILFYRSENNVILTAGVEEKGILPTAYFAKVTDGAGSVIVKYSESED